MKARGEATGTTRRGLLLASGAALASLAGARAWGAPVLPVAHSLAAELRTALAKGRALVVMVSLEGCPFCKIVRENYLSSMRAEGQPVVQLEMKRNLPLVDFAGRSTTHGAFVDSLGVKVAPTVLFFGRGGQEAAPRLAGVSIPDFYGAYLQDRVDAANRAVSA